MRNSFKLILLFLYSASAITFNNNTINDVYHYTINYIKYIYTYSIFTDWKHKYSKIYSNKENNIRFNIFKKNIKLIEEHNIRYNEGLEDFNMKINNFADLTSNEFNNMKGYNPLLKKKYILKDINSCTHRNITNIPSSIDWRDKGVVTEIKNQGQCGSCWSFSATGAVEGVWKLNNNKLISLSEEELVECDRGVDKGCKGGVMENAYEWIIKNGGITTEKNYPYTSGNGHSEQCYKNKIHDIKAHISNYCELIHNDEKDLEKALVQQPVAVAIEADQNSFQFYSDGILPAYKCGTKLDHGVLAVGYGIDTEKKMKYWIIKNSWGENWGNNGYIKLEKEPKKKHRKKIHSACGIAKAASYPVV